MYEVNCFRIKFPIEIAEISIKKVVCWFEPGKTLVKPLFNAIDLLSKKFLEELRTRNVNH